jgi:hypothetical protein
MTADNSINCYSFACIVPAGKVYMTTFPLSRGILFKRVTDPSGNPCTILAAFTRDWNTQSQYMPIQQGLSVFDNETNYDRVEFKNENTYDVSIIIKVSRGQIIDCDAARSVFVTPTFQYVTGPYSSSVPFVTLAPTGGIQTVVCYLGTVTAHNLLIRFTGNMTVDKISIENNHNANTIKIAIVERNSSFCILYDVGNLSRVDIFPNLKLPVVLNTIATDWVVQNISAIATYQATVTVVAH